MNLSTNIRSLSPVTPSIAAMKPSRVVVIGLALSLACSSGAPTDSDQATSREITPAAAVSGNPLQGYEVVTAVGVVPHPNVFLGNPRATQITAVCPSGKVPLGGGWELTDLIEYETSGQVAQAVPLSAWASGPVTLSTGVSGWRVALFQTLPPTGESSISVRVFATCAG